MRESDTTTRQRIAAALRREPATPSDLADAFDVTPGVALDHVRHVARSVAGGEGDERMLVRPPACRDCGFDGFDDRLNLPSRCPGCRSEAVEEPAFLVE